MMPARLINISRAPACSLQEASRLDPGNAAVQQLLAVARMSQGDIPDALVAFRQAIKLKPDLREAYINMASALKEVRTRAMHCNGMCPR